MDETGHSIQQRHIRYDRVMGMISWLLIAMVGLGIRIMPEADRNMLVLSGLSFVLIVYNAVVRYGPLAPASSARKISIDLTVFLTFVVTISWFSGKTGSPFTSLIYLILMVAALTRGRRTTYLMAGMAVSSHILLASADFRSLAYFLTRIFEIIPFMLVAHLGARLAGENEAAHKDVERLSLTDDVTGIGNMRNFYMLADVQEKLAGRYNRPFAICMIDADNLKQVNDRYGHLAGTTLIQHIARTITGNIRNSDICARYGGDEFVIMFTETASLDVITAVERIVATMASNCFEYGGQSIATTISAGLAGFPKDGIDVRTIIAHADEAMYTSKRNGKNRLTLYGTAVHDTDPAVQPAADPARHGSHS